MLFGFCLLLPHPNPSQSPKHSSPVTPPKEQSGFGAVSASPASCSWPSQQLGRDFQVLPVSVLLPWLQTSPVTLLWSSWIPAGFASFLQPLQSPVLQKLKLQVMGFITSAQNFTLELCLTLLSSLFLILCCLTL